MCRCSHKQKTAAWAVTIGITLTILSNLLNLGGEHRMILQQSVNDFIRAFSYRDFHRDYLILPWYVFVLFMVAVGILIYIVLQMTDLFSFYLPPDEDEQRDESDRYMDGDITPPMTAENMYHQIAPSAAAVILRQKQRAQRRNNNRNAGRRGNYGR